MTKINPGSNVRDDNDLSTARAGGMQDIDIPETKPAEKGMLQCSMCSRIFSSREDYISHYLATHQPVTTETQMEFHLTKPRRNAALPSQQKVNTEKRPNAQRCPR